MMNLSATHAVSVNPTTGEVVSSLQWASEREVDAAIALAAAGYRQWRHIGIFFLQPVQNLAWGG
ncbi:hypothetical protein ACQT35_28065, partial [Klebsiella pneumoniae]